MSTPSTETFNVVIPFRRRLTTHSSNLLSDESLNICQKILKEILQDEQEKSEREAILQQQRSVSIEIKRGDYEGRRGYFSRYYRGDSDICIFFSSEYEKSKASALLEMDRSGKRVTRIPWKSINDGQPFYFEAPLSEVAVTRMYDGWLSRCFYVDTSSLDLSLFRDRVREQLDAESR